MPCSQYATSRSSACRSSWFLWSGEPRSGRLIDSFLAVRLLPRVRWTSFVVTPTTLLDWHRRLGANRWAYPRHAGRPPIGRHVRALIVRLARENPPWGYQCIVNELKGVVVSATTGKRALREHQLGSAGKRGGPSWRDFTRVPAIDHVPGDGSGEPASAQ